MKDWSIVAELISAEVTLRLWWHGGCLSADMREQVEQLRERTISFGIAMLRLADALPTSPGAQVVARQLAKAATSIGANYRGACIARSRAEFIAKLCTVNEEADESVYWLEVAIGAAYGTPSELRPWLQEAVELRAIFSRSLSTARAHEIEPRRSGGPVKSVHR